MRAFNYVIRVIFLHPYSQRLFTSGLYKVLSDFFHIIFVDINYVKRFRIKLSSQSLKSLFVGRQKNPDAWHLFRVVTTKQIRVSPSPPLSRRLSHGQPELTSVFISFPTLQWQQQLQSWNLDRASNNYFVYHSDLDNNQGIFIHSMSCYRCNQSIQGFMS